MQGIAGAAGSLFENEYRIVGLDALVGDCLRWFLCTVSAGVALQSTALLQQFGTLNSCAGGEQNRLPDCAHCRALGYSSALPAPAASSACQPGLGPDHPPLPSSPLPPGPQFKRWQSEGGMAVLTGSSRWVSRESVMRDVQNSRDRYVRPSWLSRQATAEGQQGS